MVKITLHCFERSIAVPQTGVENMARTCEGPSAAGDPSRSGIDRANASFNAASAYNRLASANAANTLCPTKAACSQRALNLLDQSLASQQDSQISLTGTAEQIAATECVQCGEGEGKPEAPRKETSTDDTLPRVDVRGRLVPRASTSKSVSAT